MALWEIEREGWRSKHDFDPQDRTLTEAQHKRLAKLEMQYGDNALVVGWDQTRMNNHGPIVKVFDRYGTGVDSPHTVLRSGYLAVCLIDC